MGQELGVLDLLGFIVEDLHEFVTDDLPLLFWVGYPSQLGHEAVLSINSDDVHAQPFFKSGHNFIAFVLSKQAVVDKNRRQLAADCLVQKGSRNTGINPAGDPQDHIGVANFFSD